MSSISTNSGTDGLTVATGSGKDNLAAATAAGADNVYIVRGALATAEGTLSSTPSDIAVDSLSFFDSSGGTASVIREADGVIIEVTYDSIDADNLLLTDCAIETGTFDYEVNDKIEV